MRENEERWKQLCEQAAKEQDPKKLIELTRQVSELLLYKQKRIDAEQPVQERPVQGFFAKGGGV